MSAPTWPCTTAMKNSAARLMCRGQGKFVRAIASFLGELLILFISSVLGFFVLVLLTAGTALALFLGCASTIFLLIALAESVWWLYTHSPHAAVTALGFYGYAAGTFAMIPVLFFLKDKLSGWPERRR